MAEYLILIYEDEAAWTRAGDDVFNQALQAHGDFIANNSPALRDGGAALWGSDTATSIRKDAAGGFTVTDGPFAETKASERNNMIDGCSVVAWPRGGGRGGGG